MQKSFTFDKASIIKIIKGGLIAGTATFLLYLINSAEAVEITDPLTASIVTSILAFLTNAVKEWMKGE